MELEHVLYIRAAIKLAKKARDNGNHPFGALLVDAQGNILLEAENSVNTEKDCTGHAETNLIRLASKQYDRAFLASCTLYSSTEPCPMCAGAIFWGNVRQVVFGLSAKRLYEIIDLHTEEALHLSCREVMAKGQKSINDYWSALEEEAIAVHEKFWTE